MAIFTQTHFPRLWLLMQNLIGGSVDKQALALRHYRGESRILEVGCSAGNIAGAFSELKLVHYTGVDVDQRALATARKRFLSRPNVVFSNQSLSDFVRSGASFDFILFAGILHHVSDEIALLLLKDAIKLMPQNGKLIISEPEALRETDGLIFRLFYKLEQGLFLRSRSGLERLIYEAGLRIVCSEDCFVSPGIVKVPVARFNLILAGQ